MSDASRGRALFATGWGVVLTTAGAAIGLGNIWRFPYMMGQYGGSAFLVLYLLLVVAFGIPGLMAEYALGRHTRRGPAGAYQAASMPGANWWTGLLLLTMIMAGSYYGVVLAWVLRWSVTFAAAATTGAVVGGDGFAAEMIFVIVTVALCCVSIALGLRRGIERLSTIVLPVFFVLFVALIVYVLRLEGAAEGLREFLVPRLDRLTPASGLAAMGQAFFSLGLAGTLMVVYGSYMRSRDSIPATAVGTAVADVAAALMAGLIIVPAVGALGMNLADGPTLMFGVMPEVFGRMPAGNLFGALFFVAVFLIGLLSLIAAYEVAVVAAEDALGWSRVRAATVIGALEVVLAIPAVLVTNYIAYSDLLWGTMMMPIGSAVAVVALAWCVGRAKALQEIARNTRLPVPVFLYYWMKYVLPIGIGVMLVYGLIDWIAQQRQAVG